MLRIFDAFDLPNLLSWHSGSNLQERANAGTLIHDPKLGAICFFLWPPTFAEVKRLRAVWVLLEVVRNIFPGFIQPLYDDSKAR